MRKKYGINFSLLFFLLRFAFDSSGKTMDITFERNIQRNEATYISADTHIHYGPSNCVFTRLNATVNANKCSALNDQFLHIDGR